MGYFWAMESGQVLGKGPITSYSKQKFCWIENCCVRNRNRDEMMDGMLKSLELGDLLS